jgi:hypothetical protein
MGWSFPIQFAPGEVYTRLYFSLIGDVAPTIVEMQAK